MKSPTTKEAEAADKALIADVKERIARWSHAVANSPTKSVALLDAIEYLQKLTDRLEDQEPICPNCDRVLTCQTCEKSW